MQEVIDDYEAYLLASHWQERLIHELRFYSPAGRFNFCERLAVDWNVIVSGDDPVDVWVNTYGKTKHYRVTASCVFRVVKAEINKLYNGRRD